MTPYMYIVDDPKQSLMDYIDKNLDWISPFSVGEGYDFQVRIKAEVFETLPKNIKKALRKAVYAETEPWGEEIPRVYYDPEDEEASKRWLDENYWTPCDAYVFDYKAKGFNINVKQEYGPDGECITDWVIHFISLEGIPFIVWANRNTNEMYNDFVYPKNGKIYQ